MNGHVGGTPRVRPPSEAECEAFLERVRAEGAEVGAQLLTHIDRAALPKPWDRLVRKFVEELTEHGPELAAQLHAEVPGGRVVTDDDLKAIARSIGRKAGEALAREVVRA